MAPHSSVVSASPVEIHVSEEDGVKSFFKLARPLAVMFHDCASAKRRIREGKRRRKGGRKIEE
jgi:hypothetical protein